MNTSAKPSKLKATLMTLLKLGLVIAIFAWLIHQGHLDLSSFRIGWNYKLIYLLITAVTVFTCMGLQIFRSKMLFDIQGYHVPVDKFVKISWISYFFCTFLPGGITADVIKYGYFQRYIRKSRTVTALTLLVDRVSGMAALVFIAFLASFAVMFLFSSQGTNTWELFLFSGLILLSICFVSFISFHPKSRHFFWVRPLHRFVAFHTLMDALQTFRNKLGYLSLSFVLSMGIHGLMLMGIYWLQHLFYDVAPFTFLQVLLIFPVAMLASVIPIAPQGLGVSQVAIISLAALMKTPNPSEAVTLYTAVQIVVMVCFATGAIPYISYKQEHPVLQQEQAS